MPWQCELGREEMGKYLPSLVLVFEAAVKDEGTGAERRLATLTTSSN